MDNQNDAPRLFSRAAEAAVLGSMIIDAGCIAPVLELVSIDDFAFDENKILFAAVVELHEAGKKPDGVIIRDYLEEHRQTEAAGGVDYLARLLDSVPTTANVEYYSKIVQEKAARRQLVSTFENMQKEIDSDKPLSEAIEDVQGLAAGLNAGGFTSPAIMSSLGDVESKPINWFWYNRIPSGMLTLLVGDPGLGKSFLSLYMAARVSTGGIWPDSNGEESRAPFGETVLLTAEDSLSQTVRPRLDSMGADCGKITAISGVRLRDDDGKAREGFFNLQRDVETLRKVVKTHPDTKLIIVDPLSAYLGKTDSHRDSDVRSVLGPLAKLAETSGAAVLCISHLNKSGNGKAIFRVLGSIGFLAAARTVWLLSEDPDDNVGSRRRLLTAAKHNVLVDSSGLAFEIVDGKVVFEDGPVDMTSDEALGGGSTVESPKLDKAVEWLKSVLPPGTSLASTELSERARAEGIAARTLRRAKPAAGVKSYQIMTGKQNQWFVKI